MGLRTQPFENEDEFQYFTLFRDKTALEISPYFKTQTWRKLVLQAASLPSIRHAAIAIGALDKVSTLLLQRSSLPADGEKSDPDFHHHFAVQQYSRAINRMKGDATAGNQDLRTTLITSLVIIWFESYHGNRKLAQAQIQNALRMIRAWKESFRDSEVEAPLGFSSPQPGVVEHDLVRIFG
ncbi:hypothetical protein BP5796_05502 [Coleophoma crateriformis]|uniref:Transcription factor domain-containing protein n=1 Tax=Coleophoma crateriformis TaxID=565419 RepID=A0A3D8S406_9HELO|nr:hypothetical protein BP5796_05502 [Coleophoma crateriformis]